jgi:copper chaperone CopZ
VTRCDHADAGDVRTTEVRVPGADCPSCFNDALERVRQLDGVVEVRASIQHDCIEVKHRGTSLPSVLDTLRTYLHGTDNSSHECQMVSVEAAVAASTCDCGHTPATDHPLAPAHPMETLVEAMARLRNSGYANDFTALPDGNLVCRSCGTQQAPETIDVRETVRFEGDSNPDDEAILLALACTDGCLGQYSSAFGPGTAPADVRALVRLTPARR